MPDPTIIPRLQKLNMPPQSYNPFRQPKNMPEITCDACGSFRETIGYSAIHGVIKTHVLCGECRALVFRQRCAMCRQFAETTRIRMEDAYGCGYYEDFCDDCAADDNAMIERGKCDVAYVRRNYERVTDLIAVEEAIQREREKHMKG